MDRAAVSLVPSLDVRRHPGDVRVEGEDRSGLERLLGYCLRGAIMERMGYDGTRVKYRLENSGQRGVTLEWSGEEFVMRWSLIFPAPTPKKRC